MLQTSLTGLALIVRAREDHVHDPHRLDGAPDVVYPAPVFLNGDANAGHFKCDLGIDQVSLLLGSCLVFILQWEGQLRHH